MGATLATGLGAEAGAGGERRRAKVTPIPAMRKSAMSAYFALPLEVGTPAGGRLEGRDHLVGLWSVEGSVAVKDPAPGSIPILKNVSAVSP